MVYIENSFELWDDYTYYKHEYPNSYTTKDDLINIILSNQDNAPTQEQYEEWGVGLIFGISVSDEYENRCYEFELVDFNKDKDRVLVKYVGLAKC